VSLAAPLRLAHAVHEIELVEQPGRHRHGPVDAAPALLQGLEDDRLAGEVDPLGGQRQGLGDAAAGGVEQAAERAHRPGGLGGGGQEGGALLGREIEAFALRIVELHRCDRCLDFCNIGKRKPLSGHR
jgi:alkylhydroperoxidase family enzyme